ncbi:NAD(+) diphosphatase [Mesorhizobium sp. KR9-304]|uniref:NAD(+) diphosphatase n=1 Tax=Mesorhizobium sp. KR9-304 TaxID=3156614 RepID=UPI0032B3AA3D
MPFRLFDAPLAEPSQFVGFAGNIIDRQSEDRTDDSVEKALADPATRLLLMGGGRILLRFNGDGSAAGYFGLSDMRELGVDLANAVLLGTAPEGPVVAMPAATEAEALPEAIKAVDYRSVYMQGLLDPEALGALAQGASLLAWHANHRFCGKCGQPTQMRAGGYKRLCTACGTEHFPRTDPVAIMLAVSRDRCILGRGRHFAPGMYSALAGFIEPGETIENAVRRETLEESGIRLGRVVYHASQPWPFPYSLMIGCFGEALNEDIEADLAELEDCRWFERAEVLTMLGRTHPTLFTPPPGAIAHHLIRAWAESA